ncbi:hypothetical protein [Streptomyces sp. OK228]|uniref:hypothetical protein n=1 Tax=Streptomyces sp. OK228 TaxID=1882786 RepID=UPI000BD06FD3|nr:hypothetical protein [Streptomyces sp. OK228]SOE31690.1 hypothetical protein SAMN05442782_8620 [Streptomyces sp. OK228]
MSPDKLTGHRAEFAAAARSAREQRGTWVRLGVYGSVRGSRTTVGRIRNGKADFAPVGAWDAYSAACEDGQAVWARHIGGGPAPAPLPDTMAVRIRYDGEGPGYEGVGVLTVTISTRCPRCGGPRGVESIRPYRFTHDGQHLVVDAWKNPCGHEDVYAAVLAESRQERRATPTELVQAAYAAREIGVNAAQAANLLERNGYDDAAALVRGEIKNREGNFTSLQAVGFLQELTGGEAR